MTKFEHSSAFTRRSVLLGGGALVVSIGASVSLDTVLSLQSAYAEGAKPPLTPDQLSSYIAVNADGSVAAFFGKMDMGHGLTVAIGQIVAEELDVPFKRVKVFMGDTANSVNQGGASGSTGIQFGGKQMRMAAAEARRVLVEMAAGLLSTPVEQLVVNDGVCALMRRNVFPTNRCSAENTSTFSSTGTSSSATRSTRPERRNPRTPANTRSSVSRSSARTLLQRFSRKRTS